MNSTIENALKALTEAVNLASGLTHPNDKNRAKETFLTLHQHDEILLKNEIESWAVFNGWKESDADELGSLAQQIGEGRRPTITGGPWWAAGAYERWSGQTGV